MPRPLVPTALVTGANRGIGRAIAAGLKAAGCAVTIGARNQAEGRQAAADLGVAHARLDLEDPDTGFALMTQTGGFDILVNNAGGQFAQAAIDFSPKGWNAVIDTNLSGTWYMTQAAGRRWRDAGRPGSVVSIAAVVSRGMPGVAHSCAARAGVISFTQTLAIEWAPLNIRLNCVAPGIIATEGMGVYSEAARAELPKSNLMQRFGSVTDVTDAVCYLAGPSGGFITGEVLTVDGGYQLWGDQWTIERPAYFAK